MLEGMTLRRLGWVLLYALLSACASTPPREEAGIESTEDYERLGEGTCVTFLCAEEACGLFRCEAAEAGAIVPARGIFVLPPSAVRSPQRYWGNVQELPGQSKDPVFVIHWYGRELLPSQKKLREMAQKLASQPREKHHIFPQEQGLKEWFEAQGINIHKETMLLDLETHHRIHKGASGGPWNAAWRKLRIAHPLANQDEMYRYARELLVRFDLWGPIFPYRMAIAPPPED